MQQIVRALIVCALLYGTARASADGRSAPPSDLPVLAAVSADGATALGWSASRRTFTVYALTDGHALRSWTEPARAKIPREARVDALGRIPGMETAEFAEEVRRHASELLKMGWPYRDLVDPSTLAVAPDGSAMALTAGDWVYAADANGRVTRRLFDGAASDPWVSPDGRSVAFKTSQVVMIAPLKAKGPAYAMPAASGVHAIVTWSDDSSRLYVETRDAPGKKVCLVELRVANGAARPIACEDSFGPRMRVHASPDRATFLVETEGAEKETNLTWVTSAGQVTGRAALREVRHPDAQGEGHDLWEVCDALGLNDRQQALVTCGNADLGAVVLVLDPTTRTARRSEHSNEPWLRARLVGDLRLAAPGPGTITLHDLAGAHLVSIAWPKR
jgi:hypothetical protein